PKSATMIVNARRFRRLTTSHLKKIGVVLKRARYFITCGELSAPCVADTSPAYVRGCLLPRRRGEHPDQLTFDFGE
ncbi:MAG: hypothetical protein K2N76_03950, partial [Muribaculaceae bacterium]|nr:hypothetical protein [Muribaculaceae bacterium]